jgi:hypothetical protein
VFSISHLTLDDQARPVIELSHSIIPQSEMIFYVFQSVISLCGLIRRHFTVSIQFFQMGDISSIREGAVSLGKLLGIKTYSGNRVVCRTKDRNFVRSISHFCVLPVSVPWSDLGILINCDSMVNC